MRNKTTLEELLDWLDVNCYQEGSGAAIVDYDNLCVKIQEFKDKEKAQIVAAYDNGHQDGTYGDSAVGEHYYNKTY